MKNLPDLNDLKYFSAIVEAGSLSAAGMKLGVSKSRLSMHLAQLEQTLGVCLIERSTRRLQITPLGERFYHRCLAALSEVERALRMVSDTRDMPRGTLKISCPVLFAQAILMPVTNSFLQQYPDIELILDADYRDVDLLGEGYDLALKIQRQIEDSRFIVRSFALDQHWLVAAPDLVERLGPVRSPADLGDVESVFLRNQGDNHANFSWQVLDAKDVTHSINHRPRLTSSDPLVLKSATLDGIGVALLPSSLCRRELIDGRLVRLLPDHHAGTMHLHATYPSRQGLSRVARCFLDHLGHHLPEQIREVFEHG